MPRLPHTSTSREARQNGCLGGFDSRSRHTPPPKKNMNNITHTVRASSLHRLALCPGSYAAASKYLSPETPYSLHGTMLHAHMASGTTPAAADDAEMVEWCRDTVQQLSGAAFGGADDVRTLSETRFSTALSGVTLTGQPDKILWSPALRRALVVDYKFGHAAVPPVEENLQLRAYSYLLSASEAVEPGTDVWVAILQPRVSRQLPPLCVYTPADVPAIERQLARIILLACTPDAPCTPTHEACRYCPALAACSALTSSALCVTDQKLAAETLSDAELAENVRICAAVANRNEQLKAEALRRMEDGVELPGLALAPGATRKAIPSTHTLAALDALRSAGIATPEACCTVSLTSAAAELHALRSADMGKAYTKKRAADDVSALLLDYITVNKTSNSVKLV